MHLTWWQSRVDAIHSKIHNSKLLTQKNIKSWELLARECTFVWTNGRRYDTSTRFILIEFVGIIILAPGKPNEVYMFSTEVVVIRKLW